jgi:deoxyribonuclease-4
MMNHPKENELSEEKEEPLLGVHLSISGGVSFAIERAERLECNVLQIFVKNSNRWEGKEISEGEAQRFLEKRRDTGLHSVVAHDSYLINLASPDDRLWWKSIWAFVEEMQRCAKLRLDFLVTHPGAHLGSGEAEGIARVASALDFVLERCADLGIRIALETTAGQGSSLGYRFEQLRDIIGRCSTPEALSVCLDTCHIFAAGYDLRSDEGYHQTLEEFDRILGLQRLRLVHLNDSKREFSSRVDRHEHIGLGQIGLTAFTEIMNDGRLASIPKILETPKGKDDSEDRRNLETLRSLFRVPVSRSKTRPAF